MTWYSQRIYFSSAHRYHSKQLAEEENRRVYGRDYSRHGLGHNFAFSATVGGDLTGLDESGLALKVAMRKVAGQLDHRHLDQDLEVFKHQVPTAENIARYCFENLSGVLPSAVQLQRVRLQEGPRLWVDYIGSADQVVLTRHYTINCVHRHHSPDLSEDENKELYGKCSKIHGHEYKIEVSLGGGIDSVTGLVLERALMDDIVERNIIQPFDKSFLNEKIGNTSGEIILQKFYAILRQAFPSSLDLQLTVRETRKNSFLSTAGLSPLVF